MPSLFWQYWQSCWLAEVLAERFWQLQPLEVLLRLERLDPLRWQVQRLLLAVLVLLPLQAHPPPDSARSNCPIGQFAQLFCKDLQAMGDHSVSQIGLSPAGTAGKGGIASYAPGR